MRCGPCGRWHAYDGPETPFRLHASMVRGDVDDSFVIPRDRMILTEKNESVVGASRGLTRASRGLTRAS